MDRLRWLRAVGAAIFTIGAVILGGFVADLLMGHSYDQRGAVAPGEAELRSPLRPP